MILVVGNINYDILFPLEKLPEFHEKLECGDTVTGFGGSGANTAWWLTKMGLSVALAGAVGEDLLGEAHLEELKNAGVMVGGVDRVKGASGLAVAFSLGREKRMIRSPGANMRSSFHPELLDGCGLVYLSGVNVPVLKEYARAACEGSVPVVCGWLGALDSELAGMTNGYLLNSDEARRITGLENPEESIVALDADFAAVTLPAGGCVVSRGIDVQVIPAPELTPVDRTGGGDAFAAAFLAGIYLKKEAEECAAMGNGLAAEVIMERGARPEITVPAELKMALSSGTPFPESGV